MRKKRVLYNELNEEIYEATFWTRPKLVILGCFILLLSFLLNFALEEKINRLLVTYLTGNEACPIQFEKAELSYFPPKISIKKVSILGQCFSQAGNRLNLDEVKIGPDFPSIAHLGIRLDIEIISEKTKIKIDPIVSPFSQFIEIEKSVIDGKILHAFTQDDKSPIAGQIYMQGFLKFEEGTLTDGDIKMESKNFHFPSQRLSGFDLPLIPLDKLNIVASFTRPGEMEIKKFEIGKPGKQIEINLKGKLLVSKTSFANSLLNLGGSLYLSPAFIKNFSFVTLMLPQGHADGKFQMTISGPLLNPGPPQFQ